MSSVADKSFDKGLLIKWLVTLLLPCCFFLIPVSEAFTAQARMFLFLSVLAILIVAMELMDMMIPSILLPAAYVFLEVTTTAQAYKPFATQSTWMVLGAFALAVALDECGLLKRIAYVVICKLGGSYNRTLYAIYIVGIILGFLCFCGHYMLMIAFTYGICKALELKPYSKEGVVMMCVGGMAALNVKLFIYRPSTLSIMQEGVRTVFPDFYFNGFLQTWYNLPEVFIAIAFIFVVTKVCKTGNVNFSKGKDYFLGEKNKLGKMTLIEKKAAIVLAAIMLWIVTENWHGKSANYAFMILPWILFMPGVNVAGSSAMKRVKGFMGTFMFVGACLGIGQTAQALGLGNIIASFALEYLEGFGFVGITYATLMLGAIANLLLTPGAMYSLLPPILASIYQAMGFDPTTAILTVIYATDIIFMPHEVTAYLVMFGFGMMKMKHFVYFYGAKSIITIILFGIIQIPWWHFVGIA